MSGKQDQNLELLKRLESALADDLLGSDVSDEDVANMLRAEGASPEQIGERALLVVVDALSKRVLNDADLTPTRTGRVAGQRAQLLEMVYAARRSMHFGEQVAASVDGRELDELSDDELRELAQAMKNTTE